MDVILFSIKLNEICARLKTNGLKDDFEILEYFSGEDFLRHLTANARCT